MKRLLLLAGLFAPASAWAVGIVPPIPRVEKADQPGDAPIGDEDPLKTIERITKNARAVGDRLQNEDAGPDTQKTQDQLLKDIDSLLKPPPPMGGGSSGNPPPMDNSNPPPPMNNSGSGNPPPMGKSGGQQPPPMGSQSKRPRGDRQENQGSGQQPPPMPMPMGGMNDKKEPQGGMPDPKPPMDMGSSGKEPGGNSSGIPDGKGKNTPNLPLDDPFTRRVWGHLPEKLRQQAMQSYREQFMPRYSELLKQYYSTLNEKQSPNPMK